MSRSQGLDAAEALRPSRPARLAPAPVAVVGSGPVGTAVAWALVQRGVPVEIFEKGPPYPYPHREPVETRVIARAPVPLYPPLPSHPLPGYLNS